MANWNFKQNWENDVNYVAGDIVFYQYEYYLCLSANIASTPSIENTNWLQVSFINCLAYLIKYYFNLSEDRVLIDNQDLILPTDNDLFVVIRDLGNSELASANSEMIYNDDGSFTEKITGLYNSRYEINIMSGNNQARAKKDEILIAIQSAYSKFWQEVFQTRFSFSTKSFQNLSSLEGAKMLNRFSISINVSSWKIKEIGVDYYDKFETELELER